MGFNPKFYSIFYNQFKPSKNDLSYDEEEVLRIFSKKDIPEVIKINSSLYEDGSVNHNQWLRISINIENDNEFKETIGNTLLFEWSNTSLHFYLRILFLKQ